MYQQYQHQQAVAAAARAAALAQARADAAAAAAARNSGGGGGGGGGGGTYVAPGPSGQWTPDAGRRAASRAYHWLGEPYAWAGGNANGPTYGVCAGDGAFNDCNVVGFDCSGLAMYAWAQVPLAHYAATQYLQGRLHPNISSLMPGDLVFWSSDGTVGGIHHVAIYYRRRQRRAGARERRRRPDHATGPGLERLLRCHPAADLTRLAAPFTPSAAG